ncbi:MAG TPA: pilus assembly protein N-terminal domain-containing protein [Pseudolabrys sp.]|nr:pilus assembly protein N-terminal domain-containing protein [Pseudolabrys sp.]
MTLRFKNCKPLWLVCAAVFAAAPLAATQARAETVAIELDQAKLMQLPSKVATIVIGNPLIADATLQPGGILIVTGKGYGATNLLALDRDGKVVLDKRIEVRGPGTQDVVTVYKGIDRESYSCSPKCAPRITLGDAPAFFGATIAQTGSRNGQAGAAK